MRQLQFKKEEIEKQAIRRAAQRRVFGICEKLLCENRMKKFNEIQEKKAKQKERDELRLLVSQKKFQENLENYRIKSHDVGWKRNIRAQKKWRKVYEAEAYRKSINAEIDRIRRLLEVIETWIRKDVQQIAARERDTKIWNNFKHYSDQRKRAREKNFELIHQNNLARLEEIKRLGPTPREEVERLDRCNYVGEVLAGVRKLKPEMKRTKAVTSIISQTMKRAAESGDHKSKQYFGTNLMNSRTTSAVSENLMGCIFRRALVMYIKNTVYRFLPIVITELKHIIVMFEEDMSRKKMNVDKIRRLVKSFVGQRKDNMFDTPNCYTSIGFIGGLKDNVYKSTRKHGCRCDSASDLGSESSTRVVKFDNIPTSMIKDLKKDRKVSFTIVPESQKEAMAVTNQSSPTSVSTIGPKKGKQSQVTAKERKIKKKGRQVRLVSILKGCPMRKGVGQVSNSDDCCTGGLDDTCSCDDSVCHCAKEVTSVKFSMIDSSSETSPMPKESVDDRKEGKRIHFAEQPTTILVPQLDWSSSLPYDLGKSLHPIDSEIERDEISDSKPLQSTSKMKSAEASVMFSFGNSDISDFKRQTSTEEAISDDEKSSSSPVAISMGITDTDNFNHEESSNRKKVSLERRKDEAERIIGNLLYTYIAKSSNKKSILKKEASPNTSIDDSMYSYSHISSSDAESSSQESQPSNDNAIKADLPRAEDLNELDGHTRKLKSTDVTDGERSLELETSKHVYFNKLSGLHELQKPKLSSAYAYGTCINGRNTFDSGGRSQIRDNKNAENYDDKNGEHNKNSAFKRIILSKSDREMFTIHDFQDIDKAKETPTLFTHLNKKQHELFGLKGQADSNNVKRKDIQQSKDDITWRKQVQEKKVRKFLPYKKYKPPDTNTSKYADPIIPDEDQQNVSSENLERNETLDTTSAGPSELFHDSYTNFTQDTDLHTKSVTPDESSYQINKDNTYNVKGSYTNEDKPRGVNITSRLPKFNCHLKKTKSTKDRKVFSYFPKGKSEPQSGPLLNLKQIFEPDYRPVFSPSVITDKSRGSELKSILKKTSYSPAENCSLIPKYMAHYKFKSLNDLKHFIILRSYLDAGHALAASKLDENYIIPSDSDTTLRSSTTLKKHRKPQSDVNLETLNKYSHEVVPAGNETFKKLINISHIAGKDIQTGVDDQDLSPPGSDYGGDSNQLIGGGDALITNPKPSTSMTKLFAEAVPEVSQVYSEFFCRGDNVPRGESTFQKQKSLKHTGTPQSQRNASLKFKTPQDVITASMNLRGGVNVGKGDFPLENKRTVYQREKKRSPSPVIENKIQICSEDLCRRSTSSSSISNFSTPMIHKFNVLNKNNLTPREATLCEICGVCTHHQVKEFQKEDHDITNILNCSQCGRCIHELLKSSDGENGELSISPPYRAKKGPIDVSNDMKINRENVDEDVPMNFLNSEEIRKFFFKKRNKELMAYADLRAVFGHDFDPNKFVYFVDENNEYLCWNDILKRRYPLRPFPWSDVKLERLKKRKLPVHELKSYSHPIDIFKKKAAKGYANFEASRKETLDEGQAELKINWVPPKYANLFSTTHKPANRPERTFNSIKERRPTPMPSETDLVTRVLEESRGDLYEAREKLKREESVFGIMKTKIDTTVRILINILTVICILKMKRGYPDITKMCSQKAKNYYFVPSNEDKFYARKLVRGLSEFIISHGVNELNFALLEPMADIILKFVINPEKYPLLFPQSGDDILQDSDYSDTEVEPQKDEGLDKDTEKNEEHCEDEEQDN